MSKEKDTALYQQIKARRREEFKESIIKQLKSMIVPLIILAFIVVGIIVIISYKEEEEVEPIIQVEEYSGGKDPITLESDKIKFTLDPATTYFDVTVKKTGMVWHSVPEGADKDPVASKTDKEKLQSTLVLTYSTRYGVNTIYSNYKYSINKKTYDIEKGDDYIKIIYSLGEAEKVYTFPTVMTEESYQQYTSLMDDTAKNMVSSRFKKYDINKLGKKDNKEELLANYPILEDEVIYVLRGDTRDNIRKKLEEYFLGIGYTEEQYMVDRELDKTVKVVDKPTFNVSVIYRLEGDDLVVEVPKEEIEYNPKYPILNITVLPYLGAGGPDEEGFLMVPEGSGALINFNNGKVKQNSYYADVYGWDMATSRSAVVMETSTYFGVFGISKQDNSYICILEDGAPYAAITADIGGQGKANSYNNVSAQYTVTHREQYDVADKFTGSLFVYEDGLGDESFVSRYRFVESGSYVDMAKSYREYLENRYQGMLTAKTDTEAPVVVELVGAVDKVTQFLGVPVSRPLKLTTYKDADAIVSDLDSQGFNNLTVKLSGWTNGGIRQELLKSVKPVSALGSTSQLRDFINNSKNKGVDVYLDGVTNYAYNSNIWDGFIVYRDAARFVSKEKAELYVYDTVTYGKATWDDSYYLLKAPLIDTMVKNLTKAADKYGANVSFRDIGKDLSSDYTKTNKVTRQQAMLNQIDQLKSVKDAGMNVMINEGNDYAIPYADIVTAMDIEGINYTLLDQMIPFYEIAVHGYQNYTGEALNLTQNMDTTLLKSVEYGAGLYFTVMNESPFALQKTLYSEYFGASYDLWKERMVDIYTRYNKELGHTFNQEIKDHEAITGSVTKTVYDDGTQVYVNYGYEDYTAGGVTVPARDYKVVK